MRDRSDLFRGLAVRLLALLDACPSGCGKRRCELRLCRQVDRATTRTMLETLHGEDQLLMLAKFRDCPWRAAGTRPRGIDLVAFSHRSPAAR